MLAIRRPEEREKGQWLPLWQGYLEFYREPLPWEVTDLTWRRFHDPDEPVHLLGAWRDEELIGFAAYVLHRSTWAKQDYCYLEDLFVAPAARGGGVARGLIEAVAQAARDLRCDRLYWHTEEGNATARALYDRLAERTGFIQYRKAL